MFGWFKSASVASATKSLEKSVAKLEKAIVTETTHLINYNETKEKVIAKTTEIQRVIKQDYERLVAAETERFEAVKSKIENKLDIKNEAVAKGNELLAKIKTVI